MKSAEISSISDFYGIPTPEYAEANYMGLQNKTYELGPHYFLTIFRERPAADLELLGAIVHDLPDDIPIVRPVMGESGYSSEVGGRPAILSHRLPGMHYVGLAQSDKRPIPPRLHIKLARAFSELQQGLSAIDEYSKGQLKPSDAQYDIPDTTDLPPHIKPLTTYAPEGVCASDIPRYPDAVHEDMERQNILARGNTITGITDLDALRNGDVFNEFCHFLFNIALCDPQTAAHQPLLYVKSMVEQNVLRAEDTAWLYAGVYRFAVNDAVELTELMKDRSPDQPNYVDPELLVQQYGQALNMAKRVFDSYAILAA